MQACGTGSVAGVDAKAPTDDPPPEGSGLGLERVQLSLFWAQSLWLALHHVSMPQRAQNHLNPG